MTLGWFAFVDMNFIVEGRESVLRLNHHKR